MPRITTLPRNDSPNGWTMILPPRRATPALAGSHHAEFVVIGAGFAGLAAARRLAENRPQDRIAVVEALEVAAGTSGRNSGIAQDVPYNIGTSDLATLQRHVRLNRAALSSLEGIIRHHGIACHWSRRGKYHAAITDKGKARSLEPGADELQILGEPCTWLNRSELADRIGTTYFAAALHLPGCVLVDPAALVRGLADTLPANVVLYENSPVIEFEHQNGIRLTTPHGSLTADAVILATNGFVREFGFCRDQLLNYAIYASLTRPLTDGELQQMGTDRDWGLTPVHVNGGTAMRLTQDRRLFLRQTVQFTSNFAPAHVDVGDVRRRHAARLAARFPMLPSGTIQYTWVGYDAMSSNRAQAFGRSAPHVYLAVCQNGVGITKGTIAGLLAADLATGRDNPLIADIEGLGTPARLLPPPLLDLRMSVQSLWERCRVQYEQH